MVFLVEGAPHRCFEGAHWPTGTDQYHTLPQAMNAAIALCENKRTAVQAGGCVGVFPQYLSGAFERVVTFEPEVENLNCLRRNVTAKNVVIVPCGLSDRFEMCGLERMVGNPGATALVAGKDVFTHPLDAMGLVDVDFLQLDVEGYEGKALRGAEQTIRRTWPVIQVELKGLGGRVGDDNQSVVAWLNALGYCSAGSWHNDWWFTHG